MPARAAGIWGNSAHNVRTKPMAKSYREAVLKIFPGAFCEITNTGTFQVWKDKAIYNTNARPGPLYPNDYNFEKSLASGFSNAYSAWKQALLTAQENVRGG